MKKRKANKTASTMKKLDSPSTKVSCVYSTHFKTCADSIKNVLVIGRSWLSTSGKERYYKRKTSGTRQIPMEGHKTTSHHDGGIVWSTLGCYSHLTDFGHFLNLLRQSEEY